MIDGLVSEVMIDSWAAVWFAYAAAAIGSLLCLRNANGARLISSSLGVVAGLLQVWSSATVLLDGNTISWSTPSYVPLLEISFRLDPLAAVFLLALGVVGVAVSLYSFGYLAGSQDSRPGVIGFFLNLEMLSLSLVFTASNAVFFLIAWEVMALAAYSLVSFEHRKEETRDAGILFFVMSHVGTGCLIFGFLVLHSLTGSFHFSSFHGVSQPLQYATLFVLFLVGFGVKAGIVPLHIWLPAAHPVAPSNVSALMSGIVVKTGIYGLMRVCFEFLGTPPLWAAMLVLAVGICSGLLGVLYALIETDLKRLLAYSTIENVGIIFIGFGASLMFNSLSRPTLAALALVAALAHIANHALFKTLLFLAAGSVLHGTGTRAMERMGGLLRVMPATAALFLVGSIAISGLPPLNGFVSEWFTYQALLAGYGSTTSLIRLVFPVAGSLLALTGALAAATFVKAFGISFLALPRSPEAEHAHESHWTMLAGMGVPAVGCLVLGLCSTWLLPALDSVTQQLLSVRPSSSLTAFGGLVLSSGTVHGGTISIPVIAGFLIFLSAAAVLLTRKGLRSSVCRSGPTWDCGLPGLTAENEYTATAFSKPLRMIFAALYQPKREIQAEFDISPYYPKSIVFESEVEQTFESRLYVPFKDKILERAGRLRAIQAGSIHAYLAYIFITLVILLLFAVRS
ncbi:hydrogenase 4 subunit B [uncultured Paludibaculum sp.]|uniref:hydrogenase 4 subunit B n=1 Tax=uncultured Paludibaculum sp. TaxID=1765020 RepID=UPI002AAB009C|nr:hydrogenase 4 subunit B [uncultured Paludibaculum sp.]